MDNIPVPSTLHEKIIKQTKRAPFYKKPFFAPAIITLALLALFSFSYFNKESKLPLTMDPQEKLQLVFEEAQQQTASHKLFIPGHVWKELSHEELATILPLLETEKFQTAYANFSSENDLTTLFNILLSYEIEPTIQASIQIAPEMVKLDYILTGEKVVNTFQGHSIEAGIYRDNLSQTLILFSHFSLNNVAYYVEVYGEETNEVVLKDALNEVTSAIITGGAAPIDTLTP